MTMYVSCLSTHLEILKKSNIEKVLRCIYTSNFSGFAGINPFAMCFYVETTRTKDLLNFSLKKCHFGTKEY